MPAKLTVRITCKCSLCNFLIFVFCRPDITPFVNVAKNVATNPTDVNAQRRLSDSAQKVTLKMKLNQLQCNCYCAILAKQLRSLNCATFIVVYELNCIIRAFSLVVACDLLQDRRIDHVRSRQITCFCLFRCAQIRTSVIWFRAPRCLFLQRCIYSRTDNGKMESGILFPLQ